MKITQEHILTLNLLASSVPTQPDKYKELEFNSDQKTKDAQLNE